jgi:hypothetical protein
LGRKTPFEDLMPGGGIGNTRGSGPRGSRFESWPGSMEEEIFSISPNSLNLFLECPACFWLEKKMKIKRPAPYPYTLNQAVDLLLKEEFDLYRKKKELPPILKEKKLKAHLFPNQALLDQWRNSRVGMRYFEKELNAIFFGAPDDVLEFEDGKLAPLDYKTTGNKISTVYDRFQIQMDFYTFLLEKNGFETKRKGYLIFYIVERNSGFNDRLPFKKELVEIETDPSDLLSLLKKAVNTLKSSRCPAHSLDCPFGNWYKKVKEI